MDYELNRLNAGFFSASDVNWTGVLWIIGMFSF